MLVATFATVTTPSIQEGAGFSILNYARATSSKSDFAVLGDIDGMLGKAIGDRKLSIDHEITMETRDAAVVAVPWHEFVSLQPSVWTLLPSVKHVRRIRNRFLWRLQDQDGVCGSRAVVVAISVASLSTVVLAGHLKVPGSTMATCADQPATPTRSSSLGSARLSRRRARWAYAH